MSEKESKKCLNKFNWVFAANENLWKSASRWSLTRLDDQWRWVSGLFIITNKSESGCELIQWVSENDVKIDTIFGPFKLLHCFQLKDINCKLLNIWSVNTFAHFSSCTCNIVYSKYLIIFKSAFSLLWLNSIFEPNCAPLSFKCACTFSLRLLPLISIKQIIVKVSFDFLIFIFNVNTFSLPLTRRLLRKFYLISNKEWSTGDF